MDDPYAVGDDAKVYVTATMAVILRITERRQIARPRFYDAGRTIALATRWAERHARRRGNVVVAGSVVVLAQVRDRQFFYHHTALRFRWSEWIGVPAEQRVAFAAISVDPHAVPVAYVEPAGRVHAAAL